MTKGYISILRNDAGYHCDGIFVDQSYCFLYGKKPFKIIEVDLPDIEEPVVEKAKEVSL